MTTPAEIDLSALPPEVRAAFEAERAQRLALEADVAALVGHNRRLEHLVAEFRQVLYGKRSEKLGEDERQLACEDLEAAVEEARTQASATPSASRAARAGVKRNQGRLPMEPPRIERVIEPASTLWSPLERHWSERQWHAAAGRWRGSARTVSSGSTSPPPSSGRL